MSVMTLTPPAPAPPPASASPFDLYRMTVLEYERIGDKLDDTRVELLDGLMVKRMSKNPPHTFAMMALLQTSSRILPRNWTCRPEQPVRITPYDEPEPDIAIVRGTIDTYRNRRPEVTDVALLAEVSDSSLHHDKNYKRTLYATAGIPTYWIINLIENQVEVYTKPSDGDYQSQHIYKPGQSVPLIIDNSELGQIPAADLLP